MSGNEHKGMPIETRDRTVMSVLIGIATFLVCAAGFITVAATCTSMEQMKGCVSENGWHALGAHPVAILCSLGLGLAAFCIAFYTRNQPAVETRRQP